MLLFSLAFVLLQRGIYALLPKDWSNEFLHWSKFLYDGGPPVAEVRLPGNLQNTLMLLAQLALPFFFWFVTYIRLKEKEV